MKHIIIIIAFLGLFSSCENNRSTIEQDKNQRILKARILFKDSISKNGDLAYGFKSNNKNNFPRFSDSILKNSTSVLNRYNPLIYAFEEDYIDTTKIPHYDGWFRMTVDPTFRIPFCLIIEKKNGLTYLTAKMTNGYGGYFPGILNFSITKTYPDTLYNWVSNSLQKINFTEMSEEDQSNIADGEGWTFELIEQNKYYMLERRSPSSYGSKNTRELGKLGLKIKEISKVLEVLPIMEDIDPKKLRWQKD